MKLEIKHLAPYLPYGLKFKSLITHEIDELKMVNLKKGFYGGNQDYIVEEEEGIICHSIKEIKPILRPLSDLTKEIEIDGVKFVPVFHTKELKEDFILSGDESYFYNCMDLYEDFQKLFTWHFDVFGLIPAGLAIDINTIE